MDTELFELCKEVYERTGWKDEQVINVNTGTALDGRYYLYTSDYLVEKLPGNIVIEKIYKPKGEEGYFYIASIVTAKNTRVESRTNTGGNTLLIALLKLVLLLDDEDQLPHEEKE